MEKFRRELGMLLGLHAGDALGATLEFGEPSSSWNSHQEIIGGGPFAWAPGDATDDTDLMLALLKSLQGRKGIDFDMFKNRLINWKLLDPKDIGGTTKAGIQCLEDNLELLNIGKISLSNGSLMRCAPLALLDVEGAELREKIKRQTNFTHSALEVILTDELYILTLKLLIKGSTKEEAFNFALSWSQTNFPKFYHSLLRVDSTPWEEVPSSGYILDGLFCAFWALKKYDNFASSVISVVNRGDDSDTCGAITGALCGAYYGVDKIPTQWLSVLQYRDAIAETYEKIKRDP